MIKESRRDRMMQRLLQAFRDFGYQQLTMGGLANACDLSPRALYNHFKGKEDAFRETVRWTHDREIRRGWEAGQWRLRENGVAVDAIVAILDTRFGEQRRNLALSPHAAELHQEEVRRCRDLLDEAAAVFQSGFAGVLADLEQKGLLRLNTRYSVNDAAELLTAGARGVNESPLASPDDLAERYRHIAEALLFGVADRAATPNRAPPTRHDDAVDANPTERARPSRTETISHAPVRLGR